MGKRMSKTLTIIGAIVITMLLSACNKTENAVVSNETISNQEENSSNQDKNSSDQDKNSSDQEEFIPDYEISLEAEDGVMTGNVVVEEDGTGFSGTGYVEGFESDGDSWSITVEIPEDGFYDLNFISASSNGYKENIVLIDGERSGNITTEEATFTDSILERIYLEQGKHEVGLEKSWGWIKLDRIVVMTSEPLPDDLYDVSNQLINENASDSAKGLMSFLTDIYGTYFLSGQYSTGGAYAHDMACVWKENGNKYPAVLGLDLIEYSPSRVSHGSTSTAIEDAITYWEKGGIVTFCWHWNAPEKYLKDPWYSGFYDEYTTIDLEKIMNGEDPEGYDLLVSDIDAIAKELEKLKEADVPILWRPLHEASGGWFWWGASGPEAYKALYKLMYEKLTNEYDLNNLIWIWNGQDADWYPGDEYVDIIGIDIYPGEQVYTSQMAQFLEMASIGTERKMVVLSENGCLFDPDLALRDGAMWGFFATWGGEFVSKSTGLNIYSEQYTDKEMLKKVYGHELVLTLDELPDLKNYESIKD